MLPRVAAGMARRWTCGVAGGGEHPLQRLLRVVDWDGVGHGDYGGEASGGGGGGAGGDGLFPGLAGLAEVDVDVDEAGGGDEVGGVYGFGGFDFGEGAGGFYGGYAAVLDVDVAGAIEAGGGVDGAGVEDEEVVHACAPRASPDDLFWSKLRGRLKECIPAGAKARDFCSPRETQG